MSNSVYSQYQKVGDLKMPRSLSPDAVNSATNLQVQPNDVILCTFPKSGTHWTSQIIQLLMNDGHPMKVDLKNLSNFFVLEILGAEVLETQASPRFYLTHIDAHHFPLAPWAKYIVVIRNPKDCLVSTYHFYNTDFFGRTSCSIADFFGLFVSGELPFGNYFDHVLSWYERRHEDNVLLLHYEELKTDIRKSVVKIARFLGNKYLTLVRDPNALEDIICYSSFKYMKENTEKELEAVYNQCGGSGVDVDRLPISAGLKCYFKAVQGRKVKGGKKFDVLRTGAIGEGKAVFSEEMNEEMNRKIEEKLAGTEILNYWKSIGCL